MENIIDKVKESIKKKPFRATDAYSVATYGEKMNDEEIILKTINRIKEVIEAKALRNEYSMVQSLDEKIPNLKETVEKTFVELGFQVFILDKDTIPFINKTHIFICWDR